MRAPYPTLLALGLLSAAAGALPAVTNSSPRASRIR